MGILSRIQLSGFKSIKSMDLELRSLNVMIGANGSGKSNLISYFKMLNAMVNPNGGIARFVAQSGYGRTLLHHGPKVTSRIEGMLFYEDSGERYSYKQILSFAAVDELVFDEERIEFTGLPGAGFAEAVERGGYRSTMLDTWPAEGRQQAFTVGHLLRNLRPFHFDDTSSKSGIRLHVYAHESANLAADGRNLAAVLARLRGAHVNVYKRIISTIRLIAPYFGEFDFKAADPNVVLNWYEKDSDVLFGPHQISDGTLRAMCLITLLLLPDDQLPSMIIVDEPELGLHPYAIETIASLFKAASLRTQVLISTQSPTFLNQFEAEDVIVVNRIGKESIFSRPDADELNEWMERYTLGEIWMKNVIGGGPL